MFSGYDFSPPSIKEEKKSANINSPQFNASSTKIFESLAQSRTEFKNVGKIICITEDTKIDNYVRQNGFQITPSRLKNGSGVYLGINALKFLGLILHGVSYISDAVINSFNERPGLPCL